MSQFFDPNFTRLRGMSYFNVLLNMKRELTREVKNGL